MRLCELEFSKEYRVMFSNWFTPLGNLNDMEDINRAWGNIKENIKTVANKSLCQYELRHHKPRIDEECLHFLDQRRQDKLRWLPDPNQNNVDNLNSARP